MISVKALAGLAAAAYASPPTFRAGDIHAVLTEQAGVTVLAVRGTQPDNLGDWLRDLDVVPRWHPVLGFCHRGFLDGAEALRPLTRAALQDAPVLVLTGHSMGGAIALLLAALMSARGERLPAATVTFGAPRAGTQALARCLIGCEKALYRNGDDPVPDVPLAMPPELPLPEYQQPAPLRQVGTPSGDPLSDHAIARYIQAVPDVPAGRA